MEVSGSIWDRCPQVFRADPDDAAGRFAMVSLREELVLASTERGAGLRLGENLEVRSGWTAIR